MEKTKAHKLSGAAAVAAAVVIASAFLSLSRSQERLRQETVQQHIALMDQVASLQSQIQILKEELQRQGREASSLFADIQSSLSYTEGSLVLTLSVTPKEVRPGERAVLSLDAGEEAALTEKGGTFSGSLAFSPREVVNLTVSFLSEEGRRQEKLVVIYAEELAMDFDCNWADPNSISVHLYPRQEGYRSFLEGARLELMVCPYEEENQDGDAPAEGGCPEGQLERVTLTLQEDGSYRGDVSPYFRSEGSFRLYLVLTTKEGMVFRDPNPTLSLSTQEYGSNSIIGGGTLFPEFFSVFD